MKIKIMNDAVVIRLLTMSIVWLLLLVWFLNAYRVDCTKVLVIMALLWVVLAAAGIEKFYLYRRALFNECLEREGRLFAVFHNRLIGTLRELAVAAVLGSFLLVSASTLEPRQWSLLFADLLLLTLLVPRLESAMTHEVHLEYRLALARQWATWISVFLLWGEAILVLVFSPPEDYAGMRWQEVVTFAVSEPDVACGVVQSGAHIYASGMALAAWAAQNTVRVESDPTQSIMVVVGLAILVSFTFLVSLAYSRALVSVMGRPWKLWRSFAGNRRGTRASASSIDDDQVSER